MHYNMTPEKPSKKLTKKLYKSNVSIKDSSGVTHRVLPVKELKDPSSRFLPPSGQYYDQSAIEISAELLDCDNRCVLCWNPKVVGKTCKCAELCMICETKQHRGTDCSKVYASIEWWQSHGHRPRKKAQLRPTPSERAYLVVAGVLKECERLEDPVVVNMKNPIVKALYARKAPPRLLKALPAGLQSAPIPAAGNLGAIPSIFKPGTNEAKTVLQQHIIDTAPVSKLGQRSKFGSDHDAHAHAGITEKADHVEDRKQAQVKLVEEDDDFLNNLLVDTWQASSYHEGTQLATVTPLSIRLAIYTAQQLPTAQQLKSMRDRDIHSEPDPRLRARTAPKNLAFAPPTAPAHDTLCVRLNDADDGRKREDKQ